MSRMEHVGKEIAKKCGGLLLVAEALGSLMGTKDQERKYLEVQDIEIWRLLEDITKKLSALNLSYYHISSHLKQSFSYYSLFLKKYRLCKEKIIISS